MVPSPFDAFHLKSLSLSNRFVLAAAASEHAADEHGLLTKNEIERLAHFVEGEVGLIITGAALVHPRAQTQLTSCTIISDESIPVFRKLTYKIHERGGKIALQLCNSGIWASKYQKILGYEAIGVSVIQNGTYHSRPDFPDNYHSATSREIEEIINAFAQGARRAKEAGFDAVEVHGAHDSLLAQFLSPLTNKRTDEWGGSIENRTKFHRAIVHQIKKVNGEDFPVILKLGVEDCLDDGLKFDDGLKAAKICGKAGYDIIEP